MRALRTPLGGHRPHDDSRVAFLLMVAAALCTVVSAAIVKGVRMNDPAFARSGGLGELLFVQGATLFAVGAVGARRRAARTEASASADVSTRQIVVEGLLAAAYLALAYRGAQAIPVAMNALLVNASPFFVLPLAALMLGERPGRANVLAVVGGFGGVVLVLSDALRQTNVFALAPSDVFLSALAAPVMALTFVLKRRFRAKIALDLQLRSCGAWLLVIGVAMLARDGVQVPASPLTIPLMLTFGGLSALTQTCIATSLRLGRPAAVATGRLFAPLFAGLVGVVCFGETLTTDLVLGGLIIVASGAASVRWARPAVAPAAAARPLPAAEVRVELGAPVLALND